MDSLTDISPLVVLGGLLVAFATYVREIHARLKRCEDRHDDCDRKVLELEKRLPRPRRRG